MREHSHRMSCTSFVTDLSIVSFVRLACREFYPTSSSFCVAHQLRRYQNQSSAEFRHANIRFVAEYPNAECGHRATLVVFLVFDFVDQ